MSVRASLFTALIVPVGVYEERIAKSILRSGANRVYLIRSSQKSYNPVIDEVASGIIKRYDKLIEIEDFDTADFTSTTDIYRTFTRALWAERFMTSESRVLIDVTATTKEAVLVAASLATTEGLEVTYVPRSSKFTTKEVRDRYFETGAELDRPEPGKERIVFDFPKPKWDELAGDEVCMLATIYKNGGFDSVNKLVAHFEKAEQKSKRYWIRTLHKLEDRKYVGLDESGRYKRLYLTPAGEGTTVGIAQALKYAKTKKKNVAAGESFKSLEKELLGVQIPSA